jgi:hypothetical protein
MAVADLEALQIMGQPVDIELWISSRSRKGADIDQEIDAGLLQHRHEFGEGAVGMADRGELGHHQPIFVRAASL